MTLVNNAFSVTKTNLYRSNVGQAPVSAANDAADSPANYCQNMVNVQTSFLQTTRRCWPPAPRRSRRWGTTCSPSWPTG